MMTTPAEPVVPMHPNDAGAVDWGFRALLVVACLALYVCGTTGISVFDRDEARYALAVKEMSERGDWLVPTNFGEPRYNKPILCYWLALASTRVLGMNEAALRLPSALCCMLTVLLTMTIAQRMRGRKVARITGVAVATSLYVVVEARAFTADASLLVATTAAFWAWLRLRDRPEKPLRWRLLLWVTIGLGLLAKLVNIAFLGAAACALVLLESRSSTSALRTMLFAVAAGAIGTAIPGWGWVGPAMVGTLGIMFLARSLQTDFGRTEWAQLGAAWGAPLALGIFFAWGIPAAVATHGGFATLGLGHHLLGRTVTPYEGHAGWPGYYLVATLLAFFPWSPVLPAALGAAWRHRRDPMVMFLLAWVVGPWVLLELTTSKLPHYMLVTFPALAILVAILVEGRIDGAIRWSRRARLFEVVVFAALCVSVAAAGLFISEQTRAGAARTASIVLAAVALAGAVTGTMVWLRGWRRAVPVVLAACAVSLYAAWYGPLTHAFEPSRLSPLLGAAVARSLLPGERLALCRSSEASVGYYLPRIPDYVGGPDSVAASLRGIREGVVVVVPDDRRQLLARLESQDAGMWRILERVDGTILPSLALRHMLIARRLPPAVAENSESR